ncbi:Amino acid-ligase [Heracleum sosnowskyi]|uniref:Amino acid-ligase n=1 Tax=Heracleum sosnowskyi TaxID=360622 RepID=A0AAD8GRR6_9APIA|nr:Amino acid-ligase [Heracleum sosnowskyi]
MDMLEERKVIISLICPSVSLSKLVQFMALEDERIDLGSISAAFGLDPLTIKINGHWISRGLDFIASSVTWKSLISFFSARGLSTGISATEPLRVDGKLCKLGTKRVHDTGVENIIYGISEWGNKQPLDKDLNFLKKSKFTGLGAYMKKEHNLDLDSHQRKPQMRESNPEIYASSEHAVEDARNSKWDENGLKRKNQLNGVLPQKKMRLHETNLGTCYRRCHLHAAVISKM